MWHGSLPVHLAQSHPPNSGKQLRHGTAARLFVTTQSLVTPSSKWVRSTGQYAPAPAPSTGTSTSVLHLPTRGSSFVVVLVGRTVPVPRGYDVQLWSCARNFVKKTYVRCVRCAGRIDRTPCGLYSVQYVQYFLASHNNQNNYCTPENRGKKIYLGGDSASRRKRVCKRWKHDGIPCSSRATYRRSPAKHGKRPAD